MCGIAGLWYLDGLKVFEHEIQEMTRMVAHRGPDGQGVHIDGSLALGHRRLSILDLSEAGKQPMSYADGRYWITFNGEIYNFIELRKELIKCGYAFRSESDTEVIMAAFMEWGEECQLKFNGMWAFAIWDSRERRLFLSRDRFGVKPLHYYFDGKRFAFGSEMKVMLPLDWFKLEYDLEVMARAVTDNNLIEGTEDCLLKGMKRLKGGYSLSIDERNGPSIRRWWRTTDHLTAVPSSLSEQAELFRSLFFDACNIRMRSDVPIGTALSGGLDSSSVLSTLAKLKEVGEALDRHPADWQKAFVACFPGTIQDEVHYAREVVSHTGAEGIYLEMNIENGLKHLDKILFDFEDVYDFPGSIWLTYRAMRERGVVVSLDGHGGDELLGGYHFYFPTAVRDAEMTPFGEDRVHDLNLTHNLWRATGEYPEDHAPLDNSGWTRVPMKPAEYNDYKSDLFTLSGSDALTRQLYFDFHYRCLPTILRNFDRCSMSSGIEIRAPFMDWRIVTLCFSLPPASKIGQGFTKLILRLALNDVLPEKIARRASKLGFVSPMSKWTGGVLKPFLMDTVSSQSFLTSSVLNGPIIKSFIERSYVAGTFPAIVPVWKYIQGHRVMELFKAEKTSLARESSPSNLSNYASLASGLLG